MSSPAPLELKVSPLQSIFSISMLLLAVVMFPGRFLYAAWNSPRGLSPVMIGLTALVAALLCWWIYSAARRMWQETALYLYADQERVVVGSRQGRCTLRWDEIYGFTTEDESVQGETGYWLSLRGRDNVVLAQWDRNWARFSASQIKRGDEIEAFIREKLIASGRIKSHGKQAARRWEELHPISGHTALEVKTNYAWVGWMCILLFVPCTYFSWTSPTGGPVVGSLFLLFALLGVYVVTAGSTLRVDEEKIETQSLYGLRRIYWADVKSVHVDEQGQYLSFQGDDKCLRCDGPGVWKGADKEVMSLYLVASCEKRGLPFEYRSKLARRASKNTKVPR
jgi:hypothetical protein